MTNHSFKTTTTTNSSRADGKSLKDVFQTKPLLRDNAGRDLSPKRMHELNKELSSTLPHPNTTYIACVARATIPAASHKWSFHLPSVATLKSFPENIVVVPLALFLGFFGALMHHSYGLVDDGLDPEDPKASHHHHTVAEHVASDGVVSLAGQRHPHSEPVWEEEGYLDFEEIPSDCEKGAWIHLDMPDNWNHIETMKQGQRQRGFFASIQDFLLRKR